MLLVLFATPEAAGFSLLLDVVSIDLFLMIFAVQFLSCRLWLWEYVWSVFRFFADFSAHPVFVPTLNALKKGPGLLTYAVPLEGVSIILFVIGVPAGTLRGC